MADYSVHEPNYSGTTEADWDAPREKDFDTDDLAAISSHFLLSSSGFQNPDAFDDLALPVVDPDGNLNANALRTAHSGAHGVEQVEGIDDDTVEEVREILADLTDEFDDVSLTD